MNNYLKTLIIIICLLIPLQKLDAKTTRLAKGDFYEGTIYWKKMKVDLPEGKWEYIRQSSWWNGGLGSSCKTFILKDGRTFKSLISMCEFRAGGRWTSYIGAWLNKVYKRGEYDSCVLRPEYYYTNLYLKGTASNCFRVRHIDHDKEMNRPDDPNSAGGLRPILRRWFSENNVDEPKILLSAIHEYYAPTVGDNGPGIWYLINPEAYGGPKGKFFTEETSEYHRSNIDKHPEFKEFIDKFTSLSAKRHKNFEIDWKVKDRHKLDLSDVMMSQDNIKTVGSDNDVVKQLKELKELHDAGVLTKDEFEKAKKKLIN